jgi:hypothetical protein
VIAVTFPDIERETVASEDANLAAPCCLPRNIHLSADRHGGDRAVTRVALRTAFRRRVRASKPSLAYDAARYLRSA